MATLQRIIRTDAGLASALRVSIARLHRRIRTEGDPATDLGPTALAVLGHLDRAGELAVGRLAEQERVRPPSMTRVVRSLEEEGYVVRRAAEADGRRVLVALTDHGADAVHHERRRRDAWLARRLRELTPEERATLRRAAPILERMAGA